MANANTPFGLASVRAQDGNNTGVLKHYYVPATNATDLYIGDPVVKTGSANATEILGHAAGSLASVGKAAATGAITGVMVGILPNGESYLNGKLPAGQEAVILVDDDLTKKFNIQANGTVTAAMIGQNANIAVTGTGNSYSGLSGVALDVATVGTEAAKQLKIIGVADYITNEFGNYSIVEVLINNDTEAHNTAGIAAAAAESNTESNGQS